MMITKERFVQEVKQLFAQENERYMCFERITEMQDIYNYLLTKKYPVYTTDVKNIVASVAGNAIQYISYIWELEKDIHRRVMQSKGQITPAIWKKMEELHTYIQGAGAEVQKQAQIASWNYISVLPYTIYGVSNMQEREYLKMHTQCYFLHIYFDQLTKDIFDFFVGIWARKISSTYVGNMEVLWRYMVQHKKIAIDGERKKIREKTQDWVKIFWVDGEKTLITVARTIRADIQKKNWNPTE